MVPTPAIRLAREADLPDLERCVLSAWSQVNSEELPSETLTSLGADDSLPILLRRRINEIWVAETNDAIAGMAGTDADGFVWAIYVDPAFQRRGIGSSLLWTVKDHFRAKNCPALTLDLIATNTGALAFYETLGWQETDRRLEQLPGHTAEVVRLAFVL